VVMLYRRNAQTLKNLSSFRSTEFNYVENLDKQYMFQGAAHIEVQAASIDALLSPYSTANHPRLDQDLTDYINSEANRIPVEENIVIEISGGHFSDKDKKTLVDLLRLHYGFALAETEFELKLNARRCLKLLGFFAVTAAVFFIMALRHDTVFIEIPAIAAWFSLWELFNSAWLDRGDLKLARIEAGQLASMTVHFIDPDTPNSWLGAEEAELVTVAEQ